MAHVAARGEFDDVVVACRRLQRRNISDKAVQHFLRGLLALEFVDDRARNEGVDAVGVLGARGAIVQVGNGFGVERPVFPDRAEERRGHIGGPGRRRKTFDIKVGIASAVHMTGAAGQPAPRRLSAEQKGASERDASDFDAVSRFLLLGAREALGRRRRQE